MAHDDVILDPITGEPVKAHGHLNQEMKADPYEMNKEFADIAADRFDNDENENSESNDEAEAEGMSPVDEE